MKRAYPRFACLSPALAYAVFWYAGDDTIQLAIVAEGQQVSGACMAEGIVSITASGSSIGPEEARPIATRRSGRSRQRNPNCAAIDQTGPMFLRDDVLAA